MKTAVVTKPELIHLYVERRMSDQQIADNKNVDRTYITTLRKKFGIERLQDSSVTSIEKVADRFRSLGYDVENKKEKDKTHSFDILLNGHIRIEVMGARPTLTQFKTTTHYSYKYPLTVRSENGYIESDTRIRLKNGRLRKLYRKTCDYIVCVGSDDAQTQFDFWVIPSHDLRDELTLLTLIPQSVKSKYNKYEDAWYLITSK